MKRIFSGFAILFFSILMIFNSWNSIGALRYSMIFFSIFLSVCIIYIYFNDVSLGADE